MFNTFVDKSNLFPLTISELLAHINYSDINELIRTSDLVDSIVVSDITDVKKGCLYIPYEETDSQIVQAYKCGAVAILSDHNIENTPCIIVNNISSELYNLTQWIKSYINIPSVVVAGSEGKTTTKRMVKSVLSEKYNVYCKWGNYNTLQALCCLLQEIKDNTNIIVQEVDECREKSTERFSLILHPEIALITNIAEAHIGFFGSRKSIIEAFEGITTGMPDDGIVIINKDDQGCMDAVFSRRTISIGINNSDADCIAYNIIENKKGVNFYLKYNNEVTNIQLSVRGEHNVYNAMMAFIVGKLEGMDTTQIKRGLLKFRNSGIRQNICDVFGTLVYADCYNASLKSLTYSIKCFDQLHKRKGKEIAIIGDIGEIDGYEIETYKQIADLINNSNIDHLITYGEKSTIITNYIKKKIVVESAYNLQELNSIIKKAKKQKGNSYLFKASRFMSLENSIKETFPIHYKLMNLQEIIFSHK